jgi:N-methylhydantoinase A
MSTFGDRDAGESAGVGDGGADLAFDVRIGVDIGGTFTDLVLVTSGVAGAVGEGARATGDVAGAAAPAPATRTMIAAKVASTPTAPEQAVLTGIAGVLAEAGLPAAAVTAVVHGTTVGSNALLQRSGAPAGLITTRGFRDVLEIGRVRTPSMFDLSWEKPEPLVPRRLRREVAERTTADGSVLVAIDPAEVAAVGRALAAEGVAAIAVTFLNSYRNPESEIAAAAALRAALPGVAITASVEVLPEIREYERTSTTVVNAVVLPVLGHYLARLEEGLAAMGIAAPLHIVNSNGGLSSAAVAREKPVFFVSSGRSAGAVGAARLGTAAGEENLVAFDMGGTTASAVLVHEGELGRTHEYEFRAGISTPSRFIKAGGYLMRVPTVDVAEVGSGAGSIAMIDAGGLIVVGPRSAGAVPGPACYGTGGADATVTDANVALGLLPPTLAGGALALDVAAARATIERAVAAPLGLTVEAAALGIRAVANANMARAIRAVTVERGVDPRAFALFAFGGSGPAHACDLARSLGITRVLFPPAPGVFTAAGMLAGTVEHHALAACPAPLDALDAGTVRALAERLSEEGIAAMAREGFSTGRIRLAFTLDLRFRDQDFEIGVPLPDGYTDADRPALREAFLARYHALYGYVSRDGVEAVAIRLVAHGLDAGAAAAFDADAANDGAPGNTPPSPERRRRAVFDRSAGFVDTPVVDRTGFKGPRAGPLIVESADTTIVVPPGWTLAAGAAGTLAATVAGSAA